MTSNPVQLKVTFYWALIVFVLHNSHALINYGGSIAHEPEYRNRFMAKYGNNMENSRKMLVAIEGLNDEERIDLLRQLEDPLKTLKGKLPKITTLMCKPKLLMKLAQVYLSWSC